ncbi:hypothetical protein CKM354_001244800 [Cercospora kikuchii]|uniref:Vegetative incompatibility protein HET-E-1 n=1 Tax=Cercospora kikuchii TaxID=84275 RepID=A0A9P3FM02_9PEZI|nr:uncharacterized protein CKM354_001244800 [Cercospora kikuchii]GIZ49418.1 hypothetical protein CKM354_001244800 [Cercospora kikuchii]
MRLINIHTLEQRNFNAFPPRYACLSHRWQGAETTYVDFISTPRSASAGIEKIQSFCDFLKRPELYEDGQVPPVKWCWVDTCCIDKRSSAELSEAINSMAKWYRNAEFCVAYLSDVPALADAESHEDYFRKSQWFMRGWTLQELLFPCRVLFTTMQWELLPNLDTASSHGRRIISEITTIPESCIGDHRAMLRCTVALRMRWAARRQTSRLEDIAYCLLGIFQINMPLLYGEGERAFLRLQEQIISNYDDESIFAWTSRNNGPMPVLASSPHAFRNSCMISPVSLQPRPPYRISNRGLEFQTDAVQLTVQGLAVDVVQLNCCQDRSGDRYVWLIALQQATELPNNVVPRWHRVYSKFEPADDLWGALLSMGAKLAGKVESKIYHIATSPENLACMVPLIVKRRYILTLDEMYEDHCQKESAEVQFDSAKPSLLRESSSRAPAGSSGATTTHMDLAKLQGDRNIALSQPEGTMPTSFGPPMRWTEIQRFYAQPNDFSALAALTEDDADADWY